MSPNEELLAELVGVLAALDQLRARAADLNRRVVLLLDEAEDRLRAAQEALG